MFLITISIVIISWLSGRADDVLFNGGVSSNLQPFNKKGHFICEIAYIELSHDLALDATVE
jgi:hypothetical protein